MLSSLIDEIRNQRVANQTITNRLDQAERELAEQRAANIRERNQTPLDPLRATSNPQSIGLFGTPEIPSARSGRYTGENSERPPPQGMTHRSLSYSGLDEIDPGLQRPRSTPIQFQNRSTERQGEPRTWIAPAYINKFREIKAKISHPNEVVALAELKNGVWFSSKFRDELAVRAPISLDDALHRASYFATHEEEVATLKEQYSANKNNAAKKPTASKEPATKGQHSYAINSSPQKSSTYDLSKYCAFHDRKGHSTEECRAALSSQSENKKTTEETGEEEGRDTEQESPSSPPPAPKKRVDMILWGPNTNATDKIRRQTEGKIRFEITVAILTLENPDEATPPPSIAQYNPNMKPPCGKIPNFKRKNKMTKIRELLEKQIALQIQKKTECRPLITICLGGRDTTNQH
ncbi:hypothetical protein Bca52824_047237 [Brassica carinata]|uniref:Uncharacterized protein n=1 Tax=Brassica carinata TaxID=52824 RepID=A0A8X7RE98_BRACI|nr:hypothetical protein Bca52824_047237 [Brassica carinata]